MQKILDPCLLNFVHLSYLRVIYAGTGMPPVNLPLLTSAPGSGRKLHSREIMPGISIAKARRTLCISEENMRE